MLFSAVALAACGEAEPTETGEGMTFLQALGLDDTTIAPNGLGAVGGAPNGLGAQGEGQPPPNGLGSAPGASGGGVEGAGGCAAACDKLAACGRNGGRDCESECEEELGSLGLIGDAFLRCVLDRPCDGIQACIEDLIERGDSAPVAEASPGRRPAAAGNAL